MRSGHKRPTENVSMFVALSHCFDRNCQTPATISHVSLAEIKRLTGHVACVIWKRPICHMHLYRIVSVYISVCQYISIEKLILITLHVLPGGQWWKWHSLSFQRGLPHRNGFEMLTKPRAWQQTESEECESDESCRVFGLTSVYWHHCPFALDLNESMFTGCNANKDHKWFLVPYKRIMESVDFITLVGKRSRGASKRSCARHHNRRPIVKAKPHEEKPPTRETLEIVSGSEWRRFKTRCATFTTLK